MPACVTLTLLAACTASANDTTGTALTTTTVAIPLSVQLANTSHLHDGDAVTIHVAAKPGSLVYGFEARLCTGTADVPYRFDADMRPTLTGKCAATPLTEKADAYQIVRANPPFQVADGEFHVGVGSETFALESGKQATVTCGPHDPCKLVLKLQFPYGFAIRTFSLSYA